MALSYVWAADMRTFVMAPVSNGLKVIEGIKKNRRRLVWAILLAILITFVLSLGLVIYQAYRHGGINMSSWFFRDGPQQPYMYIQKVMSEQLGPSRDGWVYGGVGIALMLGLLLMRRNYAWWPLHPIGLMVMGTYIMINVWFSFFLAWLIKAVLIKYGGPRLYSKAVPFFLGLIIGQCVAAGAWVAIDFFAGRAGNTIFSAVG